MSKILAELPVLDKGYVQLIDYMGDEDAPVDGARVSFDKTADQYTEEENDRLLRYLLSHYHESPFEMVVYKFRVNAPVVVWWQWVRHRMGCLSGDTELWFDLPANQHNGSPRSYKMSISEAYRKWTADSFRKERVGSMRLRSMDEATGGVYRTNIADIWKTGVKPVYLVTTALGYKIKATLDHRFKHEGGWGKLGEVLNVQVSKDDPSRFTWTPTKVAVNGTKVCVPVYKDFDWLKAQRDANRYLSDIANDAGCSTHTIRKWLARFGLQFTPKDIVAKSRKTQLGVKRGSSEAMRLGSKKSIATKVARGSMPSGAKHHWWRGGASSERAKVAAWTTSVAASVHAKNDFTCCICNGRGGKLHAHHIIPVWKDESLAKDTANLSTVCDGCHREVHRNNQELDFANWYGSDRSSPFVFTKLKADSAKRPKRTTKLEVRYDSVVSLEYVGDEETYDLEVKGPWHNFVANGFVVHNSYNFASGRYIPFAEDSVYHVDDDMWRKQSKSNKQGSAEGEYIDTKLGAGFNKRLRDLYAQSYLLYNDMLEAGVAKEQARLAIPFAAVYYPAIVMVNARSLANFLDLRLSPDAQWEIRQYANAVKRIVVNLHRRIWEPYFNLRK